jgi:hypothetical protein
MDNDGRFPNNTRVEVRHPRTPQVEQGDRSVWPWLPATILSQVGSDEWHVIVQPRELGTLEDGSPPPAGAADEDLYYPACYRGASEIRRVNGGEEQ